MIKIRIRRDTLTPDLRRRLATVRDMRPILRGVSDVLAETAKGVFNNPSLRPTSWPPKADESPATLRQNNLLARSPRTVSAGPS